ncbi:E3 ubiquitin-protein ligase KCMF1-like [Scaptodrosophila lebanonensis]|uniref:E3 ubiquitin-protein ligase KCMF1 n=1 Tax=Drosophila lebanonensis TaxID=7225 RepID=A0A6J2TRY9_DROLE|nr:E3 ubiquitin-protein ligase KCMF1-like [Scaptodrosophila lebanonensis]
MGHRNICCDGCNRLNFFGRRFKCLRCVNYDLCGECYDQRIETHDHSVDHPMQLILENQLPELILPGETLELMHLPNCYTCPYCGLFGQSAKQLIDHVVTLHRLSDTYVVCPMCSVLPGVELVTIRNLARHLLLNHTEHANSLDPDTPPLRASLGRASRRRRRQTSTSNSSTYSQSNSNSNNNNNNNNNSISSVSSSVDSEAGIDILFQLTEMRRLRPNLANLSTRWPLAQQLDNIEEISEDEVRARSANLSTSVAAEPLITRTIEELTLSLCSPPTTTERPDADKFLLLKWIAAEEERTQGAEEVSHQRQCHRVFTEHLLLSMLCERELRLPEQNVEPVVNRKLIPTIEKEDKELVLALKDSDEGREPEESKAKPRRSEVMKLMALPWAWAWQAYSKIQFIELEGVTLDESEVNGQELIQQHEKDEKEVDID